MGILPRIGRLSLCMSLSLLCRCCRGWGCGSVAEIPRDVDNIHGVTLPPPPLRYTSQRAKRGMGVYKTRALNNSNLNSYNHTLLTFFAPQQSSRSLLLASKSKATSTTTFESPPAGATPTTTVSVYHQGQSNLTLSEPQRTASHQAISSSLPSTYSRRHSLAVPTSPKTPTWKVWHGHGLTEDQLYQS